MAKVELTPEKLKKLKNNAEEANCNPYFRENRHSLVKWSKDADPATVLALVDELTDVRMALLELAWEFYGRDQTREEIESCCAVMVENERASRKESEATP